jgi:hypothetical protein
MEMNAVECNELKGIEWRNLACDIVLMVGV